MTFLPWFALPILGLLYAVAWHLVGAEWQGSLKASLLALVFAPFCILERWSFDKEGLWASGNGWHDWGELLSVDVLAIPLRRRALSPGHAVVSEARFSDGTSFQVPQGLPAHFSLLEWARHRKPKALRPEARRELQAWDEGLHGKGQHFWAPMEGSRRWVPLVFLVYYGLPILRGRPFSTPMLIFGAGLAMLGFGLNWLLPSSHDLAVRAAKARAQPPGRRQRR